MQLIGSHHYMRPFYSLYLLILLLFSGCSRDLGSYLYRQTPEVHFLSPTEISGQYSVGDTLLLSAPVDFSAAVPDPERDFRIEWYMDRRLVHTGQTLRYELAQAGAHELMLKVVHKNTGKTYLSDKYSIQARNPFNWGWMILYDSGNGETSLGFITPRLRGYTHLEKGIGDGTLGRGPRSIHYYYVLGTITGSYISGLPKILISQSSGGVTLDGLSLAKDRMLSDEFDHGKEPEGLSIRSFAFKETYYVIFDERGNLYVRGVGRDHKTIPYYGSYGSAPLEVEGGARITHFNPFSNVSFHAANTQHCLLFDEQNGRFLRLTAPPLRGRTDFPELVYLRTYDDNAQIAPGTPRIDALELGTVCLASGAYEKKDVSGPYGSVSYWSRYVALMQRADRSDTYLLFFDVVGDDNQRHRITRTKAIPFSGSSIVHSGSVILMSADFEKHPFFYFTDGDTGLYVYSMESREIRLLYKSSSPITSLSASPLSSPFFEYGQGNSPIANFRIAAADEGGGITVLDVSRSALVSLYEGRSPEALILARLSGYGTIKGMVWCTNYQGEY